MRSRTKRMTGLAAAMALAAAPAVGMADTTTYTADLNTLNAASGFSNPARNNSASGSATLTLNTPDNLSGMGGPNSGTASLRVQMNLTGMPDLTNVPGAIHVAHIHGQFGANANKPTGQQGNGPFFTGNGGQVLVDSTSPTQANADDNVDDGFIDFFEGRPPYGPVLLNLASSQLQAPSSGTPPLTRFFQQAGAGNINPANLFPNGSTFNLDTTYTFDLSDQDQRRQFNNIAGMDGQQLAKREIVAHGVVVPRSLSDAIDDAVGAAAGSPTAGVPLPGPDGQLGTSDDLAFRSTAPIASGEITASTPNVVPTPTAIGAGLFLLGGLTLRRRRRTA